jgi:mannose-6-phosphate isomerase-like protein (cupin superfamily)
MHGRISKPLAAVLLLGLAGSSPRAQSDPVGTALLDAQFPAGRQTVALESLIESETLDADENFHIVEVGRDEGTSHHLVWIRDRERPHRHDRHDLFVVILRGHGGMRLGDEERPVGEGSILYIPRATVHAFRNASGEPAVAYAVYAPAFDGRDRVPAE